MSRAVVGVIEDGEYVRKVPRTASKRKDWSQVSVRVFKPTYFETMDDPAPLITSRKHLRRECKKRGLTSKYLEDSFNYF